MAYSYGFEKLKVWQSARAFSKNIYQTSNKFPREEIFGITSQLRRSAVSIACNLAEGSTRSSEKDKFRFYQIAYGSAIEVANLLILANDIGILSNAEYQLLRNDIEKLTYAINHLAQTVSNSIKEPDIIYDIVS